MGSLPSVSNEFLHPLVYWLGRSLTTNVNKFVFYRLAEDYNLELQYRRPFPDIWKEEKDDPVFRPLSERMGVVDRLSGELMVTHEEMEAVGFYHAFCFYKV